MSSPFKAQPISTAALEDLWCLFLHGPTRDGDLPSKSGRDWLVDNKFADRGHGWNWLTHDGTTIAIEIGMDRKKDIWQRERRR